MNSSSREPGVLVLGYHRVASPDMDLWSLCVSPTRFAEQLERICRRGRPDRLSEVSRRLAEGEPWPERSIVVTFDDGYLDTLTQATPILERFGVPATVFIPTGCIGSGREFWWDALEELLLTPHELPPALSVTIDGQRHTWQFGETRMTTSSDLQRYQSWRAWEAPPTQRHAAYRRLWELLGPLDESVRRRVIDGLFTDTGRVATERDSHRLLRVDEARELLQSDVIEFGAHTVTHAILASLAPEAQRHEIVASKTWLEALAGVPVTALAYPYGQKEHYTSQTIKLADEAGFLSACANFRGLYTPSTNRFEIPRLQVEDWAPDHFERELDAWLR